MVIELGFCQLVRSDQDPVIVHTALGTLPRLTLFLLYLLTYDKLIFSQLGFPNIGTFVMIIISFTFNVSFLRLYEIILARVLELSADSVNRVLAG